MRVLISLVSTIALAALFAGCGGSKQEDTTPAANEAAPAEGEGAEAEGAEGEAPDEGDAPQEEAAPSEEPSGAGGW
jgi:hypothetical protein